MSAARTEDAPFAPWDHSQLIGAMTRREREKRVTRLVEQSHDILTRTIEQHITSDGRSLKATVILFSGGNDSTVLAHMLKGRADYAGHANTGVGIESTREFVRLTCQAWGLPLLERNAPRAVDSYAALVRAHGFPGPAQHFKMFQRLKERALHQMQRELVDNPRRERIVFVAGRRASESARRAGIPESERRGSAAWTSPLIDWTKQDLNTYRLMHEDVPTNETANLIHMSGECLCGSFAAPGEREEITYWFPDAFDAIKALEVEIADREDIPPARRKWGWGADPTARKADRERMTPKVGALCSSCEDRYLPGLEAS